MENNHNIGKIKGTLVDILVGYPDVGRSVVAGSLSEAVLSPGGVGAGLLFSSWEANACFLDGFEEDVRDRASCLRLRSPARGQTAA